MKTHLNFATEDLARSVQFYSTLLDARPQKVLQDYALFVTDEPALELALVAVGSGPQTGNDHYGIFVETAEEVERAARRLADAGHRSSIERRQTCCYANQTKVWTTDPTGRPWEVYTVHQEIDEHDALDANCCTGC